MRSDGPLILAIVCLGTALGVLIGFGVGHTGFNASYPFESSVMHVDLTTTGAGVLGAVVLGSIGALFLVWAFLAAIVGLVSGPIVARRERVVERYPIIPTDATTVVDDEGVPVRRHFWQRSTQRTHI
jgi:hypothetical protein